MTQEITLEAKNINKFFYIPEKFQVLKNISFEVKKGEFLALVGKSGSGKSTLLYTISTMDTDFDGEVIIDNIKLKGKTQNELAIFRNTHIGFVFQFHFLLTDFTVIRNVMLPALKLGKLHEDEIRQKAMNILTQLDLADQAEKLSSKLSGGQQQRVAIARALMNDPIIIMGDEPTGNLDSKNAQTVFDIFRQISQQNNQTVITVTHDEDFAKGCDRIIELKDGALV
jgi:lipoprotein-releasing system ATP-binding protein